LTDAVNLPLTNGKAVGYYSLCNDALTQCEKLGDRFAIFDVPEGKVPDFRDASMNNLMYGAAYHPYLQTSLSYAYNDDGVTIQPPPPWSKDLAANTIRVTFSGGAGTTPSITTAVDTDAQTHTFSVANRVLTATLNDATTTGTELVAAWNTWKNASGDNNPQGFDVVALGTGGATVAAQTTALVAGPSSTLASIKSSNTALYNQIKAKLVSEMVILPPSAAVAGIYASVDRTRGVWKAPANVGTAAVIGPITKITNEDQDNLNVDQAGKSINAIRAFTGKGTLVWGARTLAGNDNEWRYVPVRRLFIMIEESARKATSFAVFEPNDMTTWLKVKGMIESFLYGLWERGALAGPAPAAAYFVNVGLGKTMTTQDILEGRMIVEIGVAAVRPAEFIILRFSHKLQQA
jgi:hypothetical protein